MDDRELIALLNQRNENAIHAVSQKYGGLCRSLISNILTDRRDAEECLNSVYMKIWRSIPPAEPHDLKAYVAKAARNEALSMLRSLNRQPYIGDIEADELASFLPPVGSEAEAKELAEAISRFLKAQPKQRRAVFIRRYWYFDSIDAVAARFGMSRSKTTSLLYRMRNELKNALMSEELL